MLGCGGGGAGLLQLTWWGPLKMSNLFGSVSLEEASKPSTSQNETQTSCGSPLASLGSWYESSNIFEIEIVVVE